MYQMMAKLDAGSRMPEHKHPQEQIVHILEGRMRLIVSGVPHELKGGESFYLASNVPHGVETITTRWCSIPSVRRATIISRWTSRPGRTAEGSPISISRRQDADLQPGLDLLVAGLYAPRSRYNFNLAQE